MQLQRPSSRTGAILSLVGAACALPGFSLPLLAGSGSDVTSSEWQLLVSRWQLLTFSRGPLFFIFGGLSALLLTLVLLFALVILSTSISACFNILSFRFLTLRRIAAINGLLIQSILSIIVLNNANLTQTIGSGLVLLLLGFLLSVVGALLSRIPRSTPHQKPVSSSSQHARTGTILSLLGSTLVLCGIFSLPMLIVGGGIGNPNNIHYPTFEWSVVHNMFFGSGSLGLQAIAVLFALPLLSMLLVLGTSIARFFRELPPGMIIWRRIAAIEGLIVQGLLVVLAYILYSISLSPDFGGGSGLALLGFMVMIVGTFLN